MNSDRELGIAASCVVYRLSETVAQQGAVRQAGEVIVMRELIDLLSRRACDR